MVLLAALVCPVPGSAEKGPAVKDYPVDRVAEDVYVIHGPLGMPAPENQGFMNNPAFVITDDGVVVIDPGASVQSGEMFLRVMAKVTKSDVMIEIPGRSIAFLGDNVLNNRVPRIDGGLIQGNIAACTRIMEAGMKTYVPGHGPTGDASVPENFRRYLETLYSTVKRYYEEAGFQ